MINGDNSKIIQNDLLLIIFINYLFNYLQNYTRLLNIEYRNILNF